MLSVGWYRFANTHLSGSARDWMQQLPDVAVFWHHGKRFAVIHGGYPVRSAENDPNVAMPVDHMRNLADEGVIGSFAGAYSFVGACSQMRLLRKTGPQWVERLQSENIDAVVLAPV